MSSTSRAESGSNRVGQAGQAGQVDVSDADLSYEDNGGVDPRWAQMQSSGEFQELKRRLRGFAFPMTAVFLAWYLAYVLMSAYARGFMDNKLLGNINVAYVFGLLQFVSTFLIAYLYYRFADKRLDPLAEKLAADFERKV